MFVWWVYYNDVLTLIHSLLPSLCLLRSGSWCSRGWSVWTGSSPWCLRQPTTPTKTFSSALQLAPARPTSLCWPSFMRSTSICSLAASSRRMNSRFDTHTKIQTRDPQYGVASCCYGGYDAVWLHITLVVCRKSFTLTECNMYVWQSQSEFKIISV